MPNKRLKLCCDSLVLELTRRCNMRCRHCLRGDAQDLDMPEQLLKNVFSSVSEIDALTFTGGEASLVPNLMKMALSLARRHHVRINEAYVATNGKEITKGFLDACRGWNAYCLESAIKLPERVGGSDAEGLLKMLLSDEDRIGCFVALSMDRFHEHIPTENLLKLVTLPHVAFDKYRPEDSDRWVLGTGRAAQNGLGDENTKKRLWWGYGDPCITDFELEPGGFLRCGDLLYVSAKGQVLNYCDYAYEEQEGRAIESISVSGPDHKWVDRLYEKCCKE